MLGTSNFIKYFIGSFFTLLLMINIIYAFNLVSNLGLPFVYEGGIEDYSDKYFGINNLITAFKTYFTNNDFLDKTRQVMTKWYSMMKTLSIDNITNGFTEKWANDYNPTFDPNALLTSLIQVIIKYMGKFFDLLVNLPYIFMVVIYFLIFLFYVLAVIFQFIGFACYLFSGLAYGTLTNTYGDLITIPQFVLFH